MAEQGKAWSSSAKNLTEHLKTLQAPTAANAPQREGSSGAVSIDGTGQKHPKLGRKMPKQMKQVGKLLLGNLGEENEGPCKSAERDADYESTLPPRVNGSFLARPLCRIENQEDIVEEDLQNHLWAQAREMQLLKELSSLSR